MPLNKDQIAQAAMAYFLARDPFDVGHDDWQTDALEDTLRDNAAGWIDEIVSSFGAYHFARLTSDQQIDDGNFGAINFTGVEFSDSDFYSGSVSLSKAGVYVIIGKVTAISDADGGDGMPGDIMAQINAGGVISGSQARAHISEADFGGTATCFALGHFGAGTSVGLEAKAFFDPLAATGQTLTVQADFSSILIYKAA